MEEGLTGKERNELRKLLNIGTVGLSEKQFRRFHFLTNIGLFGRKKAIELKKKWLKKLGEVV